MKISPELRFQSVSLSFGGIRALNNVTATVSPDIICGIIGPNGAGKTTLFNCLTGVYKPAVGEIVYNNIEITQCKPYQIPGLGISRTFQHLAIFESMTVLENIMVGSHLKTNAGFVASSFNTRKSRFSERTAHDRAKYIIEILNLGPYVESIIATLPFPIKKRVELARALALEPTLLLLDEPAVGLNAEEMAELADTIVFLRDKFKLTILLIEHHMELLMNISQHIIAMNFGEILFQGPPDAVRRHPAVIESYLGTGH